MSNYTTLKNAVASAVYTNGNGEITGAGLQTVLLQIIDTVGSGYNFMGVANEGTAAGTPDANVFYIAPAGTYTNFGSSYTVPDGSIGVFTYNGSWSKTIINIYNNLLPHWNINSGGILIDGEDIIVNGDGFCVSVDGKKYYIAPTDGVSSTTFTHSATDDMLVLDTTVLIEGSRVNPSDCLSIVRWVDLGTLKNSDIIIAFWYKTYWDFVGEFRYFKDFDMYREKRIYPHWNNSRGGIYIEGGSVIVNADGFGVSIDGTRYYIAPTDMTSETTFTPSYTDEMLVLDSTKLVADSRVNPSTALSLVRWVDVSTLKETDYIIAFWYKTYWDFVGVFRYFRNPKTHEISPLWNVKRGGIKLAGNKITINANGFGVKVGRAIYYCAPTDMVTETTFDNTDTGGTVRNQCALILDVSEMTEGARTDPSDCLSVEAYPGTTITDEQFIVALYYRGFWNFYGDFIYFEDTKDSKIDETWLSQTIIAHRGYATVAPENTMPSLVAAYENGFKAVEIDVQGTSDGVLVCIHDATINRTSDGTGTVSEMTYTQLLQYDFGAWKGAEFAGTKIMTLKDALLYCKRRNMCIEIDMTTAGFTDALLQEAYNEVKESGMLHRAMFTGSAARIRALQRIDSSVIVSVANLTSTGDIDNISDIIAQSRLASISFNYTGTTDALIAYTHNAGAVFKSWFNIASADQTAANLDDIFDRGVDFCIANIKPSEIEDL